MIFRRKQSPKLPPSSADDPVPAAGQGQPGELKDEHIQQDQNEGDEGGTGANWLTQQERRRKSPS